MENYQNSRTLNEMPLILISKADQSSAVVSIVKLLKRILKNPRKHQNMPQKYIMDGTERGVNQNPLKFLPVFLT